jgi:hypothetical protein
MPLPLFVSKTLHHEALDWATRVSSNGGVISTTTLRAVSDFCAAIDRGGLRSSMYRLNLFAGGNLSGALVPLYRGPTFGGTTFGNSTDTNVNFVSADFVETGATGGLKGNGTSKYLTTGFATNSLPSATSFHLSSSATGLATSGATAPTLVGSFDNTAAGLAVLDDYAGYVNARAFRHGSFTSGQFPAVSTPGSVESHFIGVRTSATLSTIYRGGSSAATNTTTRAPIRTAQEMYVFALNVVGAVGSGSYSASRMRMYSIGTGLDATQAAAFSAAVIAFNTALGR